MKKSILFLIMAILFIVSCADEEQEGITDEQVAWFRVQLNNPSLTAEELFDMHYINLYNLRTLPEGIFDHLTQLGSLSLSGERLSILPNGIFDHLTGLMSLQLRSQSLGILPAGVFDQLTQLEYLIFNSERLS